MHPAFQKGNVAVITGAAYGGIGFALAQKLLARGLRLVLADNDERMLERSASVLKESGVQQDQFLTAACDVTSKDSCKKLADTAFRQFGAVDVLALNAGRGGAKVPAWDDSGAFEAVFDVNFRGVLHGAQAFVSRMLQDRKKEGLVICTGSKQGITMPPATGAAYNVSKASLKAYAEMLDYELRTMPDSHMRAALLVPGWVHSKLTSGGKSAEPGSEKPAGAWTPEQTVDYLFEKLDAGAFYVICPDNETSEEVDQKRMAWTASDVAAGRPPLSRWHPDHKEAFEAHMAA